MPAVPQVNTYLNNHYEGMTPEKLIHMLFKGALKHLQLARQGVVEKNPKKRGEHLSKAIAIVSELNTSVDPNMQDESTRFLRGLYAAILSELPKVSLSNDPGPIDLAVTYIEKLNDIWETDVLKSSGQKKAPAATAAPAPRGYNTGGSAVRPKSIFA